MTCSWLCTSVQTWCMYPWCILDGQRVRSLCLPLPLLYPGTVRVKSQTWCILNGWNNFHIVDYFVRTKIKIKNSLAEKHFLMTTLYIPYISPLYTNSASESCFKNRTLHTHMICPFNFSRWFWNWIWNTHWVNKLLMLFAAESIASSLRSIACHIIWRLRPSDITK